MVRAGIEPGISDSIRIPQVLSPTISKERAITYKHEAQAVTNFQIIPDEGWSSPQKFSKIIADQLPISLNALYYKLMQLGRENKGIDRNE